MPAAATVRPQWWADTIGDISEDELETLAQNKLLDDDDGNPVSVARYIETAKSRWVLGLVDHEVDLIHGDLADAGLA